MDRIFRQLVLFAMLLLCVDAHGADDVTEQAAEHFKRGVALFKENKKEEAVKEFKTAYELKPAWKIKYNIGQCEASLRRYGLAIEAFERYLGEGGDEVSVERRDEVIKELDRLRKMVGSVKVNAPVGYAILIDGIKRGDTPMSSSILVTAGVDHEISVEKGEEVILSVKETVSGGETLELTAHPPVPETAPVPEAATQPEPEPEAASAGTEETPTEPAETGLEEKPSDPPPPARRKPLKPVVMFVGAGTAVVFGGLAGGLAVAVNAKWERTEKAINEDPWGQNADAIKSNVRTMQVLSWASLGVAGAGLILTAVAIPLTDWGGGGKDASTAALTITPYSTATGGGLSLSGRF